MSPDGKRNNVKVVAADLVTSDGMCGDAVARDFRHVLRQQAALDVAGSGEIRLHPLPLQCALVEARVLDRHRGLHGQAGEKVLFVQAERTPHRHDRHQVGERFTRLVAQRIRQPHVFRGIVCGLMRLLCGGIVEVRRYLTVGLWESC